MFLPGYPGGGYAPAGKPAGPIFGPGILSFSNDVL